MATKRWIGDALPVKQTDTITIAGVWATGKTITVTVNGKDMILTVGATVTTDSVAAQLNAALNAGTATDNIVDSESRNIGGQEIAEFQEFIATVSGSVVSLTSVTAGTPFTVTVVNDALGTSASTTATAATGPNHLGNADNWQGGLPVAGNGDTIRFDTGGTDVLYDLDYFRTNTIEFLFERTTDYTGTIGLPEFNVNGGYHEYRTRYFQLYNSTTIVTVDFITGVFGGDGGTTLIDCDGQIVTTINIEHACRTGGEDVVEITGGNTTNIYIGKASVILEPAWGAASAGLTVDNLNVGGLGLSERDTVCVIAGSLGLIDFEMINGIAIWDEALGSTAVNVSGGLLKIQGSTPAGTASVKAGTFSIESSGTINSLSCWSAGAVVFGNSSLPPPTITSFVAYGGATVELSGKSVTAPTPTGCRTQDLNITY